MMELQALEQQTSSWLPQVYAAFLLEVGNGGLWGCTDRDRIMSIDEIMQYNSAQLWNQPPPDFVCQFLNSGKQSSPIELPQIQDINQLPGLLRINLNLLEHETYGVFLTQEGHKVKIEQAPTMAISVIFMKRETPEVWSQRQLNWINFEIGDLEGEI
jgi:hypothetical protein